MSGSHRPVSTLGHALVAFAASACFAPLHAESPETFQKPDRVIVYPTLGHAEVGSPFLPQLGLRLVGTVDLSDSDEIPRVAYLDQAGRFAYIGTSNALNTHGSIVKVALGNGDDLPHVVGVLDLTAMIPKSCFIETGGEFAWFTVNDHNPGNPKFCMYRVDPGGETGSPFIVKEHEFRGDLSEKSAAWAEPDPDGQFCYLGLNDSVRFKLNPDGRKLAVHTMNIGAGEDSPTTWHRTYLPDRIMNFRGQSLLDPASRMIYAITNGGEDGVRNLLKLKLNGYLNRLVAIGYADVETGVAIVTSLVLDPETNRVHAGVRNVGYDGFGGFASFVAGGPNELPTLLGYTPFDHKIHFGKMLGRDSLQLVLASIEPSPDTDIQDGSFMRLDMNAETFAPRSLQKLEFGRASDFFGMADPDLTNRAYSFSSNPLRATEVDLTERYDILHATKIEVRDLPIIPKEMHFFSNAASGNLRLGIYSGDETKTLVWQSDLITMSEPGKDIAVPLTSGSPPSVVLGRGNYWLVWQSDAQECVGSSSERIYEDAGFYVFTSFGEFPDSILPQEMVPADWHWTQYITYVPTSRVDGNWAAYE